jgi:hypothetical protein
MHVTKCGSYVPISSVVVCLQLGVCVSVHELLVKQCDNWLV